MQPAWQNRKQDVDRYTPEVKAYLASAFITEATLEQDAMEATDLLVFHVQPYRVACRIRSFHYWARNHDEFTVRSHYRSGAKTELAKIMDGWGDFMFYGFSDATENHIHAAVLLDLNVFRQSVTRHQAQVRESGHGPLEWIVQPNKDGTNFFQAYKIRSFPPEFVHTSWVRRSDQVVIPVEVRHHSIRLEASA